MCVVCASLCVTVWCENSGVKWEEGNAVKAHGAGGAPEVMTALAFWTSSEAVGISVGTSPAPFVNAAISGSLYSGYFWMAAASSSGVRPRLESVSSEV